MARTLKGTLTLCLAVGLTSIALGQQGQPARPSILGPLADPALQKELKLSEEQISRLKDALGKVQDKYKDMFTKAQQMSPEEQQKQFKAWNEDSQKAIAGVLDAKQMKRLKQIQWQSMGVAALQDPDLQKELKLSDDQKKKLGGIFTDAQKRMQELARNRETSQEKYQTVLRDAETKANGVLSDEQKKNYKELQGPPFEMARPKGAR